VSYRYIDAAFEVRGLKPNVKLVLLCVCKYANDKTGHCFPSQTTLALDTGLALSTVKLCLKELDRLAMVVTVGKRKARNGFVNEVLVRLPALKRWAESQPSRRSASREAADYPAEGHPATQPRDPKEPSRETATELGIGTENGTSNKELAPSRAFQLDED
jgi:hypothetical protein